MALGQVKILTDRSKILTRSFSRMETTFYRYPNVKIEKSEKTGHPIGHPGRNELFSSLDSEEDYRFVFGA